MNNAFDPAVGVEIAAVEGKGVGVVATRSFAAGHAICAAQPDIAALYNDFATKRCGVCFSSENFTVCDACESHALCAHCAKDDDILAMHRIECALFCSLPVDVRAGDTDFVRFIFRYAAMVQRGDPRVMAIGTLCTNADVQSDTFRLWVEGYAGLFGKQFGEQLGVSEAELCDLLHKVQANALGFPFDDKDTLGWCLQSVFAKLNHSCQPNCCIAPSPGDNSHMVLQTLRDIDVGTELTIAYMQDDGKGGTKDALYERYRFECTCPKCFL